MPATDEPDAPALRGQAAMSPATQRAYRADWAHYAAWCAMAGHAAIPATPETVAAYLASMAASHAPSTIRRRLAALGRMHRFNGLAWSPGAAPIRAALGGVRGAGRESRPSAALAPAQLRRLVETCEDGPAGRRDRAMLLLGFGAALRRSELVALHVDDVVATPAGLVLRLQGAEVAVARAADPAACPARALEAWREVLVHRAGPLFRRVTAGGRVGRDALCADAVRRIVLRRAALAGLAGAKGRGVARLTAHGLRAGGIVAAYAAGADEAAVMRRSRHRDLRTLRGYDRGGPATGERG